MEEESVPEEIRTDMLEGKRLGVKAVLTILINDTKIEGHPGAQVLDGLVQRAMQSSRNARSR